MIVSIIADNYTAYLDKIIKTIVMIWLCYSLFQNHLCFSGINNNTELL